MTVTATTSLDRLAIGDAVRAKAMSYAAKTGTAIDLAVVTAADAKHEFSLGPIKLYNAMKANLSADELDNLPLPGQRWKDDNGNLSNNPDIAEWKDPSKPDAKAKEISFYVVWADGTPHGADVVKELEWCSRAVDDKMKKDDIPAAWLTKYSNPQDIKRRKTYLEGRRGTVRKAYKDGVRLIWQFDMVNELPGCTAELDDSGHENTVIVSNKAAPKREWKVMTVGAFLKLNVAKASEQGGTYAALIGTAERKPAPPAGTGELKVNAIATPETLDKAMLMVHSYLDKCMHAKTGADYAALLRHLNTEQGKQAILTMGGVKRSLDELFRMDTIRNTYDTEAERLRPAA